jgi:hypothetical protein
MFLIWKLTVVLEIPKHGDLFVPIAISDQPQNWDLPRRKLLLS